MVPALSNNRHQNIVDKKRNCLLNFSPFPNIFSSCLTSVVKLHTSFVKFGSICFFPQFYKTDMF